MARPPMIPSFVVRGKPRLMPQQIKCLFDKGESREVAAQVSKERREAGFGSGGEFVLGSPSMSSPSPPQYGTMFPLGELHQEQQGRRYSDRVQKGYKAKEKPRLRILPVCGPPRLQNQKCSTPRYHARLREGRKQLDVPPVASYSPVTLEGTMEQLLRMLEAAYELEVDQVESDEGGGEAEECFAFDEKTREQITHLTTQVMRFKTWLANRNETQYATEGEESEAQESNIDTSFSGSVKDAEEQQEGYEDSEYLSNFADRRRRHHYRRQLHHRASTSPHPHASAIARTTSREVPKCQRGLWACQHHYPSPSTSPPPSADNRQPSPTASSHCYSSSSSSFSSPSPDPTSPSNSTLTGNNTTSPRPGSRSGSDSPPPKYDFSITRIDTDSEDVESCDKRLRKRMNKERAWRVERRLRR